jgi:hypothetical protein
MNRITSTVLLLFGGCRHSAELLRPLDSICPPREGVAVACLYRNQAAYASVGVEVTVDELRVATLDNDHFLEVVLAPGAHRIAAGLRVPIEPSIVDGTLAPGTVTFFNVVMTPIIANIWAPTLHPRHSEAARRAIAEDCDSMPVRDLTGGAATPPAVLPPPGVPATL